MKLTSPLAYAIFWGARAQKQRAKGEHELSDADLAHLFGDEWGLDGAEKGKLLIALMQTAAKT